METSLVLVLALVAGALGVLLGYLIGVVRAGTVRADLAGALARAERLEAEANGLAERAARDTNVLTALAPMRVGLERMGDQVASLERERAAQFAALGEHLRVAEGGHEELRRSTAALTAALTSTSARGHWGEVELRRVLEAAGMLRHVDFAEQEAAGSGRPDVTVTLPGGRTVPIDAKVPFDSYLAAERLDQAVDAGRKSRLLAEHAKALRGHVDALAKRDYHGTLRADLTVMFIPSEALLAAALDADPGLLEYALRKRIAPTSPASLLALLRSVAAVWAHEEVRTQAAELLAVGRTLYERLGAVAGHMDALGKALTRSVTSYNGAVASIESRLLVTAREFEALGAEVPRLQQLDGGTVHVREFTRAELTG